MTWAGVTCGATVVPDEMKDRFSSEPDWIRINYFSFILRNSEKMSLRKIVHNCKYSIKHLLQDCTF